jgi:hypothetical protein
MDYRPKRGPPVKMVEEYRRRAVEVEQLAEGAISEVHRQGILAITRGWRELADQREQMLSGRYGYLCASD